MRRQAHHEQALEHIEPVLEDALRQRGLSEIVLLMKLAKRWPDIAGPHLALVSHPVRVRFQELLINVDDALWHQQMTFYRTQLLQNIRDVLGEVPITSLRFTLPTSSLPRRFSVPSVARPPVELVSLTHEEERQIEEGTASIADPALREAVRRAWRRGWQVKR